MQSYPLALNGSVPATSIGVDADLFVYESGENGVRKNLLKYSEQLDNAAWGGAPSIIAPDATASPDGLLTADAITKTASSPSWSDFGQNVSVGNGGNVGKTYTFSAWIWVPSGSTTASLRISDAVFNSYTGDAQTITTNPTRFTFTSAGGTGWNPAGTIIGGGILLPLNTLVYVWGLQLEEGQKATKYIKSVEKPGTSTEGDTRILVKPENGAEIILKPGQRFRIVEKASRWFVRSYDSISPINGSVIIGSGEFEDSNTANTFKLDGTFTNSVNVNNTPAQRIPVTLDTTQVLNIAGNTVQYTNSFADTSVTAVTAQVIFSPASNPNGAYLELVETSILQANVNNHFSKLSLIAKASAPTSSVDGDVVYLNHTSMYTTATGVTQLAFNDKQTTRIKIPAGKGLYLNLENAVSDPQKCSKTVLYTLL